MRGDGERERYREGVGSERDMRGVGSERDIERGWGAREI